MCQYVTSTNNHRALLLYIIRVRCSVQQVRSVPGRGPCTVSVEHSRADCPLRCPWNRLGQRGLARYVCGVVPVATVVPVLLTGEYRHYRETVDVSENYSCCKPQNEWIRTKIMGSCFVEELIDWIVSAMMLTCCRGLPTPLEALSSVNWLGIGVYYQKLHPLLILSSNAATIINIIRLRGGWGNRTCSLRAQQ